MLELEFDSVTLDKMVYLPLAPGKFAAPFLASQQPEISRAETNVGTLLLIFGLFAAYGAAFNFAGQLRYVEAALLLIGLLSYNKFSSRVDLLEWKLSGLFMLTACAQLLSNIINQSPSSSTIARVGTYALLSVLIPVLAVVINRDWRRLLAVVFGFGFSFFVVRWTGGSVSQDFDELPWRLGLGASATFIMVAVFAVAPKARLWLTLGLFCLAGLHLYFESRSLAAITCVVAFYCLLATFWARPYPAAFKVQTLSAIVVSIVVFAYAGPLLFTWLADSRLLSENLVTKNQVQAANRYGFLAAARPDTFTALYAISKKPILGYGSGNFDSEVFAFYAEVNAASYRDAQLSRRVFKSIYQEDWLLGIPSHSHLFGAWADAGIFAALSWLFIVWLNLKMLAQLWRWGHPFAPLFVFVGIETLWDVLLSPGPIRLDIAVRVAVIATAFRYIDLCNLMKHFHQNAPAVNE
jgi:hypothetical protein